MKKEEAVLVVKREEFERIGIFHGIKIISEDKIHEELLNNKKLSYLPRSEAENNPNFKQIIPYVIFVKGQRGKEMILGYQRSKKGGEGRLHGKLSIGIGGHMNDGDENFVMAVERERNEEVRGAEKSKAQIVALLNDDSNEVGQVHLGVVLITFLDDDDKIESNEDSIANIAFHSIEMLKMLKNSKNEMETWSSLCLENIDELIEEARENKE